MLLEELFLTEKLGNLAQLKVGSMINILKQAKSNSRNRGDTVGPTGKKFGGGYTTYFGNNSEVIDVGVIKNGIGGLRKAYKEHDDAEGFALYVNNVAICFGLFSPYDLSGSSRTSIFAYDLTSLKTEVDKKFEADKEKRMAWQRDHMSPRALSSYSEKEPDSWEKKRGEKIKVYHGEVKSTSALKSFIEELIELVGDKPITCKLITRDKKSGKTRGSRNSNNFRNAEVLTGLEELKRRLAKYKISKKPTVDTIEGFLAATIKGGAAVVQFAGKGYKTTAKDGYDKMSPLAILNGHSFSIDYSSVEPSDYGSHISVFYKFDKDTGVLKPFKAEWPITGDDGYGKTESAALEPDTFIKHELGIKSVDKDEIIKKILSQLKSDGSAYNAKRMIASARKAGHDYPEFKAIEKSIAASEAK